MSLPIVQLIEYDEQNSSYQIYMYMEYAQIKPKFILLHIFHTFLITYIMACGYYPTDYSARVYTVHDTRGWGNK